MHWIFNEADFLIWEFYEETTFVTTYLDFFGTNPIDSLIFGEDEFFPTIASGIYHVQFEMVLEHRI